jgi:hypothetical protein
VVIDKFYNDFEEWYSPSLNKKLISSLEVSWLLATFFHDRFKPLQPIGRFLSQEMELRPQAKTHSPRLAGNIASIYAHVASGGKLDSWNPPDEIGASSALQRILLGHMRTQNHGVLGALTLLSYPLVEHGIPAAVVYSSALAIAMHDVEPRDELLRQGFFPVKMEMFPLVVLLLYCDAVQEWNRSSSPKAELVDIAFRDREVTFVLEFSSPRSSTEKSLEFESIDRCVARSPIRLGLTSSIFIGSRL